MDLVMRRVLRVSVVCLSLLAGHGDRVFGKPAAPWAGINPGHGTLLADPDYAAAAARETVALGLQISRIGIDRVGGAVEGAPFTWSDRDRAIDAFREAGIEVRGVISFRSHISQKGDVMASWRYFVRSVAAHYAGRVAYYIIDNEPDLAEVPPATAVEMTCAAHEEIKAVDPSIRIESPPHRSPRGRTLPGFDDRAGRHPLRRRPRRPQLWRAAGRRAQVGAGQTVGIHGAQRPASNPGGQQRGRQQLRRGAPRDRRILMPGRRAGTRSPMRSTSASPTITLLLFSLRSPRGLWDAAGWRDGALHPQRSRLRRGRGRLPPPALRQWRVRGNRPSPIAAGS